MQPGISHSRESETLRAKARWFQSLTLDERMDYLVAMVDLILENNPTAAAKSYAQPASGRVQVLSLPQG
jgi:hypothetical protein